MIADVNGRESVLSDDLEDLLVRTPLHRSPVLARSRLLKGLLLCAISGVGVVDAPGAARRREVRSFDGDPRTADVRNASSSRGRLRHSAPVVQAGRLGAGRCLPCGCGAALGDEAGHGGADS